MTRAFDKTVFVRLVLLALASAAPNAFPLSQMGFGSLHDLAWILILPAAVGLVVAWGLLKWRGANALATLLVHGAIAGAVATLALEAVRYPAFRLGFMPGNLPRLMGVLLFDRFALGPSTLSDLAGFAYHAWNGASFGIVFVMLAKGRSSWWALPFGLAVGLGFLASPVVQALGVGPFGRDFGWRFAATVMTAHAAFGLAMTIALQRLGGLDTRD
jgi:hypothetical protein